jgi:hypothetical protein
LKSKIDYELGGNIPEDIIDSINYLGVTLDCSTPLSQYGIRDSSFLYMGRQLQYQYGSYPTPQPVVQQQPTIQQPLVAPQPIVQATTPVPQPQVVQAAPQPVQATAQYPYQYQPQYQQMYQPQYQYPYMTNQVNQMPQLVTAPRQW